MKKIFVVFLFFIFYFLFPIGANAAASLSLSPTSQSVAANQTFTIDLNLNTGGVSANGCDVILTFNSQILKVETVSFGATPLFSSTNTYNADNTNGKLTINSSVMSSAFAYSGSGKLATITFKGQNTGSTAVSFTCTAGAKNDTNIWNTQAQDIVDCSANIAGAYTVTSASTTPTPTTTTEATPTPAPPVAGNTSLTMTTFLVGTFFILSGLFLRFFFLKV